MSNRDGKTPAQEAIDELVKALSAGGYNAAPSGPPSKGFPLEVESLDITVEPDGRFYPTPDDRYPHTCPKCKGPAYIGALEVDCKNKC